MPSAVLLKRDVRLDVPSVAPSFAEHLGMTVQDARMIVRKARGIFQEWLPEAQAQKVAEALQKIGVDVTVTPQAEIPPCPLMRRIFGAKVETDGFDMILNPLRPPVRLPWSSIHFVSIGVIATPQYQDFLTSKAFKNLPPIHLLNDPEAKAELRKGLASRALRRGETREGAGVVDRARVHEKMDKRELQALYRDQTVSYMDLWSYGSGKRYRISRAEFDYSCLGSRAQKTSMDNFRILLGDLWAKAPKALYTRMSNDFLSGAELHDILFDNLEEFDRYTRWFLHAAAGASPKPGVLAPGANEGLLGPEMTRPVDQVETVE